MVPVNYPYLVLGASIMLHLSKPSMKSHPHARKDSKIAPTKNVVHAFQRSENLPSSELRN